MERTLTGKENFKTARRELAKRGITLEKIEPSGMYRVAIVTDRLISIRTDDLEDAILTGKDMSNQ